MHEVGASPSPVHFRLSNLFSAGRLDVGVDVNIEFIILFLCSCESLAILALVLGRTRDFVSLAKIGSSLVPFHGFLSLRLLKWNCEKWLVCRL
jgi:hypothetical protein